jgi:hypothetical protein
MKTSGKKPVLADKRLFSLEQIGKKSPLDSFFCH